MRNFTTYVFLAFLLCSCTAVRPPADFKYKEIQTPYFRLASWQKITVPGGTVKIYIEGDGYAFDALGQPSHDPTPHGTLLRKIAFGDKNPNVVYLARPCQYVKDYACEQKFWTTARFAPEVIKSEAAAIRDAADGREIIFIGFSGGAQAAGLVAVTQKDIKIKKVITIAGNLDHSAWCKYHNLPPLEGSLNLADYRAEFDRIPQKHYAGGKDEVMPASLIKNFAADPALVTTVPGAAHNRGWETIYNRIRSEE